MPDSDREGEGCTERGREEGLVDTPSPRNNNECVGRRGSRGLIRAPSALRVRTAQRETERTDGTNMWFALRLFGGFSGLEIDGLLHAERVTLAEDVCAREVAGEVECR